MTTFSCLRETRHAGVVHFPCMRLHRSGLDFGGRRCFCGPGAKSGRC